MSRSPERSFLSVSCSFEDAMGACESGHAMCRGKSKLGKIEASTVAVSKTYGMDRTLEFLGTQPLGCTLAVPCIDLVLRLCTVQQLYPGAPDPRPPAR